MLDKNIRNQIVELIQQQVVPAIGCTEPMAVALCTARSTELLGCRPEAIEVFLSPNMLKNAMGVGIPGTGMIGLPITVALGALIGKSEYKLEVIKDLTPESLEAGKQFIANSTIDIKLKENNTEKLYIEVVCKAGEKQATSVIIGSHTNFVYEAVDGKPLYDNRTSSSETAEEEEFTLNLRMVYDFATTSPIEELEFIRESKHYNMRAAAEALKENYGHCLGKLMERPLGRGIFGNSIFSHIISKTASACDARMGGALVPVMSNSGSGNQGICATNPVVVFAKENENTKDELTRALALSHLTVIYIKQSLGRLSALCGCVVASIGSSCGITYLMGGNFDNICNAVKNMIANLTGIICDGAKPSCALKISSGVSTAVLSAMLSIEGKCVSSAEGIIEDDVDKTIHNLTSIGKDAMSRTDDMILKIMTSKGNC